jgi:hypothetical protein
MTFQPASINRGEREPPVLPLRCQSYTRLVNEVPPYSFVGTSWCPLIDEIRGNRFLPHVLFDQDTERRETKPPSSVSREPTVRCLRSSRFETSKDCIPMSDNPNRRNDRGQGETEPAAELVPWVSPAPQGDTIRFKDGNRLNTAPANLELVPAATADSCAPREVFPEFGPSLSLAAPGTGRGLTEDPFRSRDTRATALPSVSGSGPDRPRTRQRGRPSAPKHTRSPRRIEQADRDPVARAFHQAGHVIVARSLGLQVEVVSLHRDNPDLDQFAFSYAPEMYGLNSETLSLDDDQAKTWSLPFLTHYTMFLCSGFVAEATYLGIDPMSLADLGDLAKVDRITMSYFGGSVKAAQEHLDRIKPLVEEVLEEFAHDLGIIATSLLNDGRLSGADIENLFQPLPNPCPVEDGAGK